MNTEDCCYNNYSPKNEQRTHGCSESDSAEMCFMMLDYLKEAMKVSTYEYIKNYLYIFRK